MSGRHKAKHVLAASKHEVPSPTSDTQPAGMHSLVFQEIGEKKLVETWRKIKVLFLPIVDHIMFYFQETIKHVLLF